jgi:hypothetical protein
LYFCGYSLPHFSLSKCLQDAGHAQAAPFDVIKHAHLAQSVKSWAGMF